MKTSLTAIVLMLALLPACNYKKLKQKEMEPVAPPETISYKPGSGPVQPHIVRNIPSLDRKVAMNDLKQLHLFAFVNDMPPASLEQFADLPREAPKLYAAVKEGHYVVCWGANRNNGEAIFAYWKGVPDAGGPAILVNGSPIENMTTEQFKATPKAGKTN